MAMAYIVREKRRGEGGGEGGEPERDYMEDSNRSLE